MSGATTLLDVLLQGPASSQVQVAFLNPFHNYRAIGPEAPGGNFPGLVITADVVEEEEHRDVLFITEHPVESGAAVNDHAFKRPAEVSIRMGWSNSSHYYPFYVQYIYKVLLRFQADRTPFDLYTGKRVYHNMLLTSLMVRTDSTTEYALIVDATLTEIFLVQTQAATISTNPNNLANPSAALPTQAQGSKVLQPPNGLNVNGAIFGSGGPLSSLAANIQSSLSSFGAFPLATSNSTTPLSTDLPTGVMQGGLGG